MSFQARLMFVAIAVLTIFGGVFGWLILAQLQQEWRQQAVDELIGDALTVRDAWNMIEFDGSIEQADRFADQMGRSTQSRITLIRDDGRVGVTPILMLPTSQMSKTIWTDKRLSTPKIPQVRVMVSPNATATRSI